MLDHNVPKTWQGQTTLVFALASAALGLGNVYRFSYAMGEHGGAPFFLAYVLTLVAVVIPLLSAEVMLGSHGRGSPVGAIRWVSDQAGRSFAWSWLGWWQVFLGIVLAVKLVSLTALLFERAQVLHSGVLAAASAQEVFESFKLARLHGTHSALFSALVLVAMALLAGLGPNYVMAIMGWIALPAVAMVMVGLVDFAFARGNTQAAWEYLFARDFSTHGWAPIWAGMSSALFTMGAGLGVGLCFGARAPKGLPLVRSVCAAAIIDTTLVLLSALVLMALLFAVNVAPAEGVALVFVAAPYAFANLPLGEIYGALYFAVLGFASFAALMVLSEPAVMVLRRDVGIPRWRAALLIAALVAALVVVEEGVLAFEFRYIWRSIDVLLVVGMLLTSVFVGWRLPRPLARGELYLEPRWLFLFWWLLLRFVVPAVLVLLLYRYAVSGSTGVSV